jgi:serine/threonine protein kinase
MGFYADPAPAGARLVNLAVHTQKLMTENWRPRGFRYYLYEDFQPQVWEITDVYPTLTEAMREEEWVISKRLLGSGTFANVYLGFRYSERRLPIKRRHLAAVKQMYNNRRRDNRSDSSSPSNSFAEDTAPECCSYEIEILERLKHENIVRMLANFAVEKTRSIFIVVEFCDNKDLKSEMSEQEHGRYSIPVARYYFKQIMSGVAFMHSKFVAHCDLKLENVLVKRHPNGKDKIIKIADFGNAVIFKYVKDGRDRIAGGSYNRGTAKYQPPEVLMYRFRDKKVTSETINAILNMPYRPNPISEMDQESGNVPNIEPPVHEQRPIVPLPQYLCQGEFPYPPVDVYCCGVMLYVMITGFFPFEYQKWPDNLDYVLRCQPMTCFTLMDRQTWDFIKLLLEPLFQANVPPHQPPVTTRRPTAAQVLAMGWMEEGVTRTTRHSSRLDKIDPKPGPSRKKEKDDKSDSTETTKGKRKRKKRVLSSSSSSAGYPAHDPNEAGPSGLQAPVSGRSRHSSSTQKRTKKRQERAQSSTSSSSSDGGRSRPKRPSGRGKAEKRSAETASKGKKAPEPPIEQIFDPNQAGPSGLQAPVSAHSQPSSSQRGRSRSLSTSSTAPRKPLLQGWRRNSSGELVPIATPRTDPRRLSTSSSGPRKPPAPGSGPRK